MGVYILVTGVEEQVLSVLYLIMNLCILGVWTLAFSCLYEYIYRVPDVCLGYVLVQMKHLTYSSFKPSLSR